jgi:hypothetical protein
VYTIPDELLYHNYGVVVSTDHAYFAANLSKSTGHAWSIDSFMSLADEAQTSGYTATQVTVVETTCGWVWASRCEIELPPNLCADLGFPKTAQTGHGVGGSFLWAWPEYKSLRAWENAAEASSIDGRNRPLVQYEPSCQRPGLQMLTPELVPGCVEVPEGELSREQRFFLMNIAPFGSVVTPRHSYDTYADEVIQYVGAMQEEAKCRKRPRTGPDDNCPYDRASSLAAAIESKDRLQEQSSYIDLLLAKNKDINIDNEQHFARMKAVNKKLLRNSKRMRLDTENYQHLQSLSVLYQPVVFTEQAVFQQTSLRHAFSAGVIGPMRTPSSGSSCSDATNDDVMLVEPRPSVVDAIGLDNFWRVIAASIANAWQAPTREGLVAISALRGVCKDAKQAVDTMSHDLVLKSSKHKQMTLSGDAAMGTMPDRSIVSEFSNLALGVSPVDQHVFCLVDAPCKGWASLCCALQTAIKTAAKAARKQRTHDKRVTNACSLLTVKTSPLREEQGYSMKRQHSAMDELDRLYEELERVNPKFQKPDTCRLLKIGVSQR